VHQSFIILAQMSSLQGNLKFFLFWQFVKTKFITTSISRKTSHATELVHCHQIRKVQQVSHPDTTGQGVMASS